MTTPVARPLTLALCGDVMTGRGIDQILPHPGAPQIYERYVPSARDYVMLAERINGPIPQPADFAYIWGEALIDLARAEPAAWIVNLETAITRSDSYEPKGINYRMNPQNAPSLTAARVDCCTLANNHMLDWGVDGLLETLDTLADHCIAFAGAGRNAGAAAAPAIIERHGGGRILVFALGCTDSGIPPDWAATASRPGVNFLPSLDDRAVAALKNSISRVKRPGDVAVMSIHWGGNWGYGVPDGQRRFAHALIDTAGIDVVQGHSSHHPKAIEVYRGKPIFYGCGDFINDYEGIGGYKAYRGDLSLLYFAALNPDNAGLSTLVMAPFQMRKFRLNRASRADAEWLRDLLTREGRVFGSRAVLDDRGMLHLEWE